MTSVVDPITALAFSIFENKGVYALLLGSGVSRAAEIPTGWEITLDLVRRVAALQSAQQPLDLAEWHKTTFGGEPNYSDLLDRLASTPDERRSILHSYIEPTEDDLAEGRKIPTKAHHAVARLVRAGFVRVIITTNFDRLIENALREAGVEPTVIKSDDDLAGAVPLIHSRCYLIKVHGDYLDTRIRNTDIELSAYSAPMNALLDRVVDEHGLIISGWSSDWDPALRAIITRAPNRRYPLFWSARGRVSQLGADLIDHRGGRIVPIGDADAFFDRLEKLVALQTELQRPNPHSIDLLVAGAKKAFSHEGPRVQFEDLVGHEIRDIEFTLKDKLFNPSDGQPLNERFATMVGRLEGATEALARIIAVAGRWGKGEEFRTVTDTISALGSRPGMNGLVVVSAMRTYPAVLLFYSYGLSLLKRGRYSDLYNWFSFEVRNRNGRKHPLTNGLFLQTWSDVPEELFKTLPGLEKLLCPMSEHLYQVFTTWTADYIFSGAEFTQLFEEFELLASLALLTLTSDLENLKASATRSQGNFVWTPFGRISWDRDNREAILENTKEIKKSSALLAAGFANGDKVFFAEALASLERQFMYPRFR
jgi:hypothetical protein